MNDVVGKPERAVYIHCSMLISIGIRGKLNGKRIFSFPINLS
jgi:hypothetical protein